MLSREGEGRQVSRSRRAGSQQQGVFIECLGVGAGFKGKTHPAPTYRVSRYRVLDQSFRFQRSAALDSAPGGAPTSSPTSSPASAPTSRPYVTVLRRPLYLRP